MQCITPIHETRNRQQEAAYRKEALRAASYTQHIIDDFVEQVFLAAPEIGYKTIYIAALDDWNATMEFFAKKMKRKFKHIEVDPYFFSKHYAPRHLVRIP